MTRLGVALVGAGYWGPKIARNLAGAGGCELLWVCDLVEARAESVAILHGASPTASIDAVLDDPRVAAVAIATPAATHAELARRCLQAGRHVLVEKPFALSVAEARDLAELACRRRLVAMCDHTYCFSAPGLAVRKLVRSGGLGEIAYIDSVRVNRGVVQPDVDVFWDLAHHDIAILDQALSPDEAVVAIQAEASDPIGAGRACIGDLTLQLAGGATAHVRVSWLHPTKVRTFVVGGRQQTLVWDDLDPTPLRLYPALRGDRSALETLPNGRAGGGPVEIPTWEPLSEVVRQFLDAVRDTPKPMATLDAELRVLSVLEAASRSLRDGGSAVAIEATGDTRR